MRKMSEIQNEIEGLTHSIGLDSYECAVLNSKVQLINQRIQGNLARMDQLINEKPLPPENPPQDPINELPTSAA